MSAAPRIPIPLDTSLRRFTFPGADDHDLGENSQEIGNLAASSTRQHHLTANHDPVLRPLDSQPTCEAAVIEARRHRAFLSGRARQRRLRMNEPDNFIPPKPQQREKYVKGLPKLDNFVRNFTLGSSGLIDQPHCIEEYEPEDESATTGNIVLPHEARHLESPVNSFKVTSATCIVKQAEKLLYARFDNIRLMATSEQNSVSFADLLLLIHQDIGAPLDDLLLVHKDEFRKNRDSQVRRKDNTLSLGNNTVQRRIYRRRKLAETTRLQKEVSEANKAIIDLKDRIAEFEILGTVTEGATRHCGNSNSIFNSRSTFSNAEDALEETLNQVNALCEQSLAPPFKAQASDAVSEPVNIEFGRIIGEDDAGPIFDYGELEKVHMRGGGRSDFSGGGYDFSSEEEDFEDIVAKQKRQMLDDDDTEVDRSIPNTWRVSTNKHPGSVSSANDSRDDAQSSERSSRQPPAFNPSTKESEASKNQNRHIGFKYARHPNEGYLQGTWTTKDPVSGKVTYDALATQRQASATSESVTATLDSTAPENSITAAVFGEAAALCASSSSKANAPRLTKRSHDELGDNSSVRGDLPGLELEVREQFLSIQELGQAQKPRTAFEQRNASLLSTNSGEGNITMILDGKEFICSAPTPDKRLKKLDRYGNYIGRNEGAISKRLLRGHRDRVAERDEEMLRASAEYKHWQSLTIVERLELLSIRRHPIKYWNGVPGAHAEDQHEVGNIPEEYTRNMARRKRLAWTRSATSSQATDETEDKRNDAISQPTSDLESGIHNWQPLGDCGDTDDTGRSLFSTPTQRNGSQQVELLKLVLRPAPHKVKKSLRPSKPSAASSVATYGAESSAIALYNQRLPHELYSDSAWGGSQASKGTRTADDLLDFDDTPELQPPEDIDFHTVEPFDKRMEMAFANAEKFGNKRGRAVVVRLHKLVKYTPHAIAKRVFGGTIQELQLHPEQDLAIVIFLHAAEARSFVKHVSTIRSTGWNQDIVRLQIEVDWGKERESILEIQPRLVAQNLHNDATRALKLHRIPLEKTKEEVFQELGIRMGKLLVSIYLEAPKQIYLQMTLGRQAVIEFASIKDAIESREALLDGRIDEYTVCAPEFANDPASNPAEEKSYCECMGCKEIRAYRVSG